MTISTDLAQRWRNRYQTKISILNPDLDVSDNVDIKLKQRASRNVRNTLRGFSIPTFRNTAVFFSVRLKGNLGSK